MGPRTIEANLADITRAREQLLEKLQLMLSPGREFGMEAEGRSNAAVLGGQRRRSREGGRRRGDGEDIDAPPRRLTCDRVRIPV